MIKNEILNEKYMHFALDLAARAEGKTSPNPMVGAVIVKQGKIIGKGYHKKAGWPHAEINALKDASRKCSGAEMFVTLEPCDHHGRTPPCTQAIIKSGIKKIHIAMKDPNPVNNGGGVKALRRAGIAVEIGLCGEEAEKMNRKYLKYVRTGMPYVTAKVAQSMDGKVAAADGTS